MPITYYWSYLRDSEFFCDKLAGPLGLTLGEEPAPVPVHYIEHLSANHTQLYITVIDEMEIKQNVAT
jgi:hypothetical protein